MNIIKVSLYQKIFFFTSLSITTHTTAMLTYHNHHYPYTQHAAQIIQYLNHQILDEIYFRNAALHNDNLTLIRLINNGININAQDAGTGNNALHIASELGYIEIVETLLIHRARVNIKNRLGCTPLHFAISSQRSIACVNLLIKYGAHQRIKNCLNYCPDNYLANEVGQTPIEGINKNKTAFVAAAHATLLRKRLEMLELFGY